MSMAANSGTESLLASQVGWLNYRGVRVLIFSFSLHMAAITCSRSTELTLKEYGLFKSSYREYRCEKDNWLVLYIMSMHPFQCNYFAHTDNIADKSGLLISTFLLHHPPRPTTDLDTKKVNYKKPMWSISSGKQIQAKN